MQIFITGTDTNIGKTLVASWLCIHTGYDYFKPIQTGSNHEIDSLIITQLTESNTHKETYIFKKPLSPHLAARLENTTIDLNKIILPMSSNLIIEGAGGLMVPINPTALIIDLIELLDVAVILVAGSRLGTINHTLLSLDALRARNLNILGVIISGDLNQNNADSIEFYGNTKILAQFPFVTKVNKNSLKQIPLPHELKEIFKI